MFASAWAWDCLKRSSSILPAGANYALYAAECSILTGRYFYNLSCLHVTEATRTFIKHTEDDSHPNTPSDTIAAWETLMRLLAALPFVDIPRTSVSPFPRSLFQRRSHPSNAPQAAPRADDHVPQPRKLRRSTFRHGCKILHGKRLQGYPGVFKALGRHRRERERIHGQVHPAW